MGVQIAPADGSVDAVAVCRVHIQRLISRDRERCVTACQAGTAELLFTMFCACALTSVYNRNVINSSGVDASVFHSL